MKIRKFLVFLFAVLCFLSYIGWKVYEINLLLNEEENKVTELDRQARQIEQNLKPLIEPSKKSFLNRETKALRPTSGRFFVFL